MAAAAEERNKARQKSRERERREREVGNGVGLGEERGGDRESGGSGQTYSRASEAAARDEGWTSTSANETTSVHEDGGGSYHVVRTSSRSYQSESR